MSSITSNTLISLLEEILPTNQTIPTVSKEARAARLSHFKSSGDILPSSNSEIIDFKLDPLLGKCTWYQLYNEKETFFSLSFYDIDFWMFGYQYQSYVTYPGVYLAINQNASRTYGSGVRFDSSNVKTYIHIASSRSRVIGVYQSFTDLANKAQKQGILGLSFPEDWDEIPYTV